MKPRARNTALLSVFVTMFVVGALFLVAEQGGSIREGSFASEEANGLMQHASITSASPSGSKAQAKQVNSGTGASMTSTGLDAIASFMKRASSKSGEGKGAVSDDAVEVVDSGETARKPAATTSTSTETMPNSIKHTFTVETQEDPDAPKTKQTYVVTLRYSDEAGIPNGAQIVVQLPDATDEKAEERRLESLRKHLDLEEDQRLIQSSFINIRLESDGRVIQPQAPVELSIRTNTIDPAVSDSITIVAINSDEAKSYYMKNLTGTDDDGEAILDPKVTNVQVTTTEMGDFALAVVAKAKFTWHAADSKVQLWGPLSLDITVNDSKGNGAIVDNMELLDLFDIRIEQQSDQVRTWVPQLWLTAQGEEDLELELDEFGGVLCYKLADDKLGDVVFGKDGTAEPVAIASDGAYALLWDSGYRETTFSEGEVQLEGNVPTNATADVTNATKDFANAAVVTGDDGGNKYDYETVAAYDVNFEVDGSQWQPDADHAVAATVNNDAISQDSDLEVWHVTGEDASAPVQVDAVEDGNVSFSMEDSGTYVVVERISLEREFTASDDNTYRVTVSYDGAAGLPRNAELEVKEIAEGKKYDKYVASAAKELGAEVEDVTYAKALDISLVDPNTGEKYQPTDDVSVRIELLDNVIVADDSFDLVHFANKYTAEVVGASIDGNTVAFSSKDFSVFMVLAIRKEQTLTASDGKTYRVSVTYDSASGIPADAKLDVSEIKKGDAGYNEYIAKSADALGEKPKDLAFAKAFDIALKNPVTGEEYQPNESVNVSIELLKDSLSNYADIDVVHIPDRAEEKALVLASTVRGESVEFTTDGFSVYVVTGSTALCTYYFYTLNEYGDYVSYSFYNDQGEPVSQMTIKNGEKLFAPSNPTHPTDPDATFIGWYVGSYDSEGKVVLESQFDFSQPQNIVSGGGKDEVNLYAVFSKGIFVRFHGQYNSADESYPLVEQFGIDPAVQDAQGAANVDLKKFSATYINTEGNSAFPKFAFKGWSETPVEKPGEGENLILESPYRVTESVDLYSIFEEIRWLSFASGNSGTGATYYSPTYCAAAEGIYESAFQAYIPSRQGYSFKGWFLAVEHEGTDGQNGTGLQLTDENGHFIDGFNNVDAAAYHVKVEKDGQDVKKLFMSQNVTIYARWEAKEVDYTIVVWKQVAAGADYVYAEKFSEKAIPYNKVTNDHEVSVRDDYKYLFNNDKYNSVHDSAHQIAQGDTNPYEGYTFDEAKSDIGGKKIAYEGTTSFDLYYNTTASGTLGTYVLTFDYPGETLDVEYRFVSGSTLEGTSIPPAPDPAKEGHEFLWYADEGCTTRVFFDRVSYNGYKAENPDGLAALYTIMPTRDLTVYGKWTERWYLIEIDPNYGELYRYNESTGKLEGDGSTFFWKAYKSDYIQEYTWVTRDYVESESGDYYYVNHDYSYRGDPDRKTYYTKDVSEATELKTFMYAPGTYVASGWYEEGTEEPYNFGEPITGNVKLKMHWKLAGDFHLEYNAVVTVDGERLDGTLGGGVASLQDGNSYVDQAKIDLVQTAEPPEGYVFVGWRVRGDNSGKVYYPGTTLLLPGEFAVTVGEKQMVYLDAVYDKAPTATIVYDANGGTITESADGGYPYTELDENNEPKEPDPKKARHKVSPNTNEGTVKVSGIANNSPIRLSSGIGFSAPQGSGAEISGWNTKKDGSGTHYDLNAWKVDNNQLYYADAAEPIKLYAEWKVKVYFHKNAENYSGAVFSSDGWDGYTEENGQYCKEVCLNAKLEEPQGKVTTTDRDFDFWSTTSGGGQENAFDFARTEISGPLTLYAHLTNAIMVPFHVTQGTTNKDSWRKTAHFRLVPNASINLTSSSTDIASYVNIPDGYILSYACVSEDAAHVSDADESKVVIGLSRETDAKITLTYKNDTTSLLSDLGDGQGIYLAFAPETPLDSATVKFVYVKEIAGGVLSKLTGSTDGSTVQNIITYNGKAIALSGVPNQDEKITVTSEQIKISQDSARGRHMLPLLDDGTDKLDQVCYKIAVGGAYSDGMNIRDLDKNISTDLNLYLQIRDNKLCRSFDGKNWAVFPSDDYTVYAIYRERGYDLEISKTVSEDDTGIDPEKIFTVTITSNAITRQSYTVEGTGYSTVEATPATSTTPGKIVLSIKDGGDIKVIGLAKGTYTVEETNNDGFEVSAKLDGHDVNLSDSWALEKKTKLQIFNKPHYLCRIQNPDTLDITYFYTLNRALEYAGNEMSGTATIEMLRDYIMPSTDALEIPAAYDITFTSRNGPWTIKRDPDFKAKAMFTNYGTLQLGNDTKDIMLDGNGDVVKARMAMIQNYGTLDLDSGVTLQNANSSGSGGAVYSDEGSVTISGANLVSNSAQNGGAIYALGGTVTLSSGTLSENHAQNGGAIYMAAGTVSMSGGSMANNSAAENGGAIYATGGKIEVSGGSISGNGKEAGSTVTAKGGAIYTQRALVELSGSAQISSNGASFGGAIYTEQGTVNVSDCSMEQNMATAIESNGSIVGGCGGAVYAETATVKILSGTMTQNEARSLTINAGTENEKTDGGFGGAVYVDGGILEMAGGTIGGSGKGNIARNGAGVYINTGYGYFSGQGGVVVKVINNTPSENGGAVGVGSDDVRLYFTGKVQVKENMRNIYLDRDSSEIIVANGLDSASEIGVYVPGELTDEQFKKHGSVGGMFGTYSASSEPVTIFKNDRIDSLKAIADTDSNKVYWGKDLYVQVWSQESYSSYPNNFAPKIGQVKYPTSGDATKFAEYYPMTGEAAMSELADDLNSRFNLNLGSSSQAVFAAAFTTSATTFDQYLTEIRMNSQGNWVVKKRSGEEEMLADNKLIFFFSNPAYISIQNNIKPDPDHPDDNTLTISAMNVLNGTKPSVINNPTDTNSGYGLVFARDGVILSKLRPVTAEDLVLKPGASITILIPGGRSQKFSLTGQFFSNSSSYVELILNGENESAVATNEKFEWKDNGNKYKTHNNSLPYEIIFGGGKKLCKIAVPTGVIVPSSAKYTEKHDSEYAFATLNDAFDFAKSCKMPDVTIQLLQDYLMPISDAVDIDAASFGFKKITLTTATSGYYQYIGSGTERRATISRGGDNKAKPLFLFMGSFGDDDACTELDVHDLNFDGKSLTGACDGGALKTNNCTVTITNADFENFVSYNGGSLYLSFGDEEVVGGLTKYSYPNAGYKEANYSKMTVTVTNAKFKSDKATSTKNRAGGGAVWCNANVLTMNDCEFSSCRGEDQGGAVFHRIDSENKNYPVCPFAKDSSSYFYHCAFTKCEGRSGGAVESDAHHVTFNSNANGRCIFTSCKSVKMTDPNKKYGSGGAISTYVYEKDDYISWGNENDYDTSLTITNCDFTGCTTVGTSITLNGHGGAIRSHSYTTTITNCTIRSCSATYTGGAISTYNGIVNKLTVDSCTISGCSAGSDGGAIYYGFGEKKGDYKYAAPILEIKGGTNISRCATKAKGGAVCHYSTGTTAKTSITESTIDGCTAVSGGGGYYTNNVKRLRLNSCTVQNCVANTGNGAGICYDTSSDSSKTNADGKLNAQDVDDITPLILTDCEIKNNQASGTASLGGGIYTKSHIKLVNTNVTGNRIGGTDANNAAGIYLLNERTLIVGEDGSSGLDTSSVKNNVTDRGKASNMRLWWNSDRNHENSVRVLCNLSGKIYVIDAARKGDKFGISMGDYLGFTDSGFKEREHTFIADDNSLYGVFDRTDENPKDGKDIIWRGDVVCKLTTKENGINGGKLLYLDPQCNEPAIFDRLDYATDGSPVSPFSYLRQDAPRLYTWDEASNTGVSFDVNTKPCCVQLMVQDYKMEKKNGSNANVKEGIDTGQYPGRTIILTTAGRMDSLYPYTGKAGTYATIKRGNVTQSLITAGVNLTLRNITLDGSDTSGNITSVNDSGGLIYANTSGITVTLAENSMLQNSKVSDRGGAVLVDGCSLSIAGGQIYKCSAAYGGGVCKTGNDGGIEFSSGLIARCSATENGGGVYLENGSFTMSGGSQITHNEAAKGGGVFVNDGKTMEMTGGAITQNAATASGGGIATGGDAKLYFSGRVTISGNKLGGTENCNVELDSKNDTIINSKGLSRGSYIGVYVSGNYVPLTAQDKEAGKKHNDGDGDPYLSHGGEGDPFGKWTGDSKFLYFFINDRNNLKGGLTSDQTLDQSKIYWTTIFSLEVSKLVMSDNSADTDEEFSFSVELSGYADADSSPASSINEVSEEWDDGTTVQFSDGVASFKLRSGESRVWNNLPAGVSYKVTENLTSERRNHYTTLPDDDPTSASPYKNGKIGENLNKSDVDSKYLSRVAFRNMTAVCKLTLVTNDYNNGILLYEYDEETGARTAAVYSRLATAFSRINAATPLVYRDAFTNRWTRFDYSKECHIEMLIPEYSVSEALTLNSPRQAILTTADPDAEDYPYTGTGESQKTARIKRDFTQESSMFTANGTLTFEDITIDGDSKTINVSGGIANIPTGGTLKVKAGAKLCNCVSNSKNVNGSAIHINGGAMEMSGGEISGNTTSGNGGAVYMSSGTMTMSGGYITNNNAKGWGGGAVRIQGGSMTMSGGEISGNKVQNNDANGGAISVRGGNLTVSGGKILNNEAIGGSTKAVGGGIYVHTSAKATISGGEISGNKATTSAKSYGGAVYVDADNKTGTGGELTLSGGTFKSNTAATDGAGIYLVTYGGTKHGKLFISGEPVFGKGSEANTVTKSGYADLKNGNDATAYAGDKVRQDIYITGYENASDTDTSAASLNVNGDISSGGGSIWVWAEESPRYKRLCQFAKYTTDVTDTATTLAAFRNARDDKTTEAEQLGEYLYGITKADDTGRNVFWYGIEGSRKVILRKVSNAYGSLAGAVFQIHKGSVSGPLVESTDINGDTKTSFTSGASGVYFMDELPYGTYYLHEKTIPSGYQQVTSGGDGNWYILTVNEDGVGYQATGTGTTIENTITPEATKPN